MMWLAAILGSVAFLVWAYVVFGPRCKGSFDSLLDLDELGEAEVHGSAVIVVPARDEADVLSESLASLCSQDHANHSVTFVDDASSDGTGETARQFAERHPHLNVVSREGDPPTGWAGKVWAVITGVWSIRSLRPMLRETLDQSELQLLGEPGQHIAEPDWLCFTDADIVWDPRTLRIAQAWAEREEADIVGLLPDLEFSSTAEAILLAQMALALGIMFPIRHAMDPDRPNSILIGGAFIFVRRELYASVGGHTAVKGSVVEDINLGRKLKAAGGKVRVAHSEGLLTTRMYHDFADLWDGLTKHAYAGLEYRWWAALGMGLTVIVVNVLPPVVGATGWVAIALGHASTAAWIAAVFGTLAWWLGVRALDKVRGRLGLPWWHALMLPVGSTMYGIILLGSIWRYYRGGAVWKGRRIRECPT